MFSTLRVRPHLAIWIFSPVLLLLTVVQPAAACTSSPPFPPVWIKGDVCVDGKVQVRFHNYFTFASTGQFCSCALSLPGSIGNVIGAALYFAETDDPVPGFDFQPNANANFGGGGNWNGFSTFVDDIPDGLEVDLVFWVEPVDFQCDARAKWGNKASASDFSEQLAHALRDAEGGVVGTGGANEEGIPEHHVSVQSAGPIEIELDSAGSGEGGGGGGGSGASSCQAAQKQPCRIDLRTGQMSSACNTTSGLTVLSGPQDSNGDDWLESVLQVQLTDGCSRACVVLDYAEKPTGFTLDIGDSATNNGYGGNSGGPENASEVDIKENRLTAYSDGHNSVMDRVQQELVLNGGSFKVCVSDHKVSFGQPAVTITTPFSNSSNGSPIANGLFAIPDTDHDGNSDIYIGLNRVISSITGAPSGGRTGTGLRRAYISID